MSHSYRILHVEDSPEDSELVRMSLRKAPFAFAYTRVETEAEYRLEIEKSPDVILCDYDLPRFSAELALEIRNERGLEVPFIIVSQHIGQSNAVIAMQQGASDYLPKRNLERLAKAIEAAVERATARAERTRAREELRVSESMRRSILNSLTARIAMIDGQGVILALNKAWADFSGTRGDAGLRSAELGDDYFALLRARADEGSGDAQALLDGILAVVARESPFFTYEYQLGSDSAARWYRMRAFALEGSEDGAVISHADITDRMISHIALDQAHKRMQTLSKRVLSVQEEERRSISRDLHDDIGQSLTALKIGLHRVAQQSDVTKKELVAECVGIADDILEKLRQLALELRPPQLDQLGLADALQWLVDRQKGATGLDIRCDVAGLESRRPPATLESACYRIAQEAISNATRHASAKSIVVTADSDGRLLKLTIRDDGVGFDQEAARQRALKSGSLGLISMEERAELAGGRLKLRSVIGGGTTLSVIFPLPAAKSQVAGAIGQAAAA